MKVRRGAEPRELALHPYDKRLPAIYQRDDPTVAECLPPLSRPPPSRERHDRTLSESTNSAPLTPR